MLPELQVEPLAEPVLKSEYSSSNITLDHDSLRELLAPYLSELPAGVAA